jgi:hypothetical protein
MAIPLNISPEEHQSVAWPIASFAIDRENKSGCSAHLLLDRANSEFGFVRYTSNAVAVVVQFPDTGEPIYFSVKDARAAAWREKCRKISILFQHLQVDLDFGLPEGARGFLDVLEDLAMAAGNHFFYSFEVPR